MIIPRGRMKSCLLLGFVAMAVLSGGLTAAEVPASIARVAAAYPGEAEAALYVRVDGGKDTFILDSLPFGESYKKVLIEQCDLFEKKTGLNPLKHLQTLTAASVYPEGKRPPESFLIFAEMSADPRPVLAALKKEGKGTYPIQFEGEDGGTLGELGFKVVKDGIYFGTKNTITELDTSRKNEKDQTLAASAAGAVSKNPVVLLSGRIRLSPGTLSPPMQMLTAAASFSVGMDDDVVGLRLKFQQPNMAEPLAAQVNGLAKMLLTSLEAKAAAASADPERLLDILDLQRIDAKASYRGAKDLFDNLTLAPDGDVLRLTLKREALPNLGSTGVVALAGVAAAIAIPNFRAARLKANKRACFANQKVLMGATEMYNLDYNTNVETLDKEFLEKLKKEGYLMAIPNDPGQGDGTWSNYQFTGDDGPGMACKAHGSIDGTIPGSLAGGGAAMSVPMSTGQASAAVRNETSAQAKRAMFRACYANQKVLAGAIEMYELDQDAEVDTPLDGELLDELKEEGYLRSIPQDPGQGEDSELNYYFDDKSGNGIACEVHGSVDMAVKGTEDPQK